MELHDVIATLLLSAVVVRSACPVVLDGHSSIPQ